MALPVAIALSVNALAVVLAGVGLLVALLGLALPALRRGAGFGLAVLGLLVCGSALIGALALCGGAALLPRPAADQLAKGTAAQEPRAEADGRRAEGKRGEQETAPLVAERKDKPKPQGPVPSPLDIPEIRGKPKAELPAPGSGTPQPASPPPNDPALAALVRDLEGDSTPARCRAAEELGRLGKVARPATRALCKAATSPDSSVRGAALEALEKVQPALHKPVVTLLVDEDRIKQHQALDTLGKMDGEARPAAPAVLANIKRWLEPDLQVHPFRPGGTPFVPYQVPPQVVSDIGVLAKIAPDDQAVVKALIDLVKVTPKTDLQSGNEINEAAQIHEAAVTALREAGKADASLWKQVVPAFIVALETYPEDWPEQRRCLAAVAGLREAGEADPTLRKQIVPALIRALDTYQRKQWGRDTCIAVMRALGAFGSGSADAIPAIKNMKLDPDSAIREVAGEALAKIDPQK
jgi:HEAT repeat protein